MRSYQAVLFDFGGVLTASPFELLSRAAAGFGISPEAVLSTCFGSYDQDTDHPWHRLERGELSVMDAMVAISALAAESGYDMDPIAILRSGMSGATVIRDDVVEVVREVRATGRKTAIVTNNIREFGEQWRALLPLDELFDAVVDSCEVGLRKPNPRIYQLALDAVGGIAPQRAVLLDDAPGNVAAARAFGLHAIHVGADHRPAIEELRAVLAD